MKMNDEDPDSMVVHDGPFNEAGMAEQMFAEAGLPQ